LNIDAMTPAERQELVDRFYWYHSIVFDEAVASRGVVNHAAAFHRYGFPAVTGRSVLDVGTGDGYFAFEFERLSARRVVAVDINRWTATPEGDAPARTRARRQRKFLPFAGQEQQRTLREQTARELGFETPNPFHLAHRLRCSRVEFKHSSIYDLPQLGEPFDLVFVGTVTTELQDLPAAFEAVRQVTRGQAVIACADLLDFEPRTGWRWAAYHAMRALGAVASLENDFPNVRDRPVAIYAANEGGSIWQPSVVCIREMLLSAGFRDVDVYSRFALDNLRNGTRMKHVVFHAFV
jgi:ubiquinone/menaquinone biosynthesis C-methylase UbiE